MKTFICWLESKQKVKCQWCGKEKPDNPGICPHCARFPRMVKK